MATASNNNKKSKSGTKKKPAGAKAATSKKVTVKKTAAAKTAVAKKTVAKKAATPKKAAPKKAVSKKVTAKKPTVKKTVAKKAAVKKPTVKKTVAKKAAVKKAAVKKAPAKKQAKKTVKKSVKKSVTAKKSSPTTAAPSPAIVKVEEKPGHMSFMLLAGLGILAFLAYGILQSGRDGSKAENERNLITASQLIQYGVAVEKGVEKLRSAGVALSQINFEAEPDDDDAKALFASAGGDVLHEDPPWHAGGDILWRFLDVSDARDGFLISGLGSDAAVRGREVVMYLDGLSPDVCKLMRKGWGLDETIPVQDVKVDFDHRAANHAGANATTFHVMPGRGFSCFRNGRNGSYVYYHAVAVQ